MTFIVIVGAAFVLAILVTPRRRYTVPPRVTIVEIIGFLPLPVHKLEPTLVTPASARSEVDRSDVPYRPARQSL
jgi:hypothetical protein